MKEIPLVDWKSIEKETRSLIRKHYKDTPYIDTRRIANIAVANPDDYPVLTTDINYPGPLSSKGIKARISMLSRKCGWKYYSNNVIYNPL